MRSFVFFLLGAFLGTAAAAFLLPHIIHWWAQPPYPMGCDCGPAVVWAMRNLTIWESVGAAVGAVSMLVLSFVLGARRRKPFAAPPTSKS
jgi:hypothetical protein